MKNTTSTTWKDSCTQLARWGSRTTYHSNCTRARKRQISLDLCARAAELSYGQKPLFAPRQPVVRSGEQRPRVPRRQPNPALDHDHGKSALVGASHQVDAPSTLASNSFAGGDFFLQPSRCPSAAGGRLRSFQTLLGNGSRSIV